jgi:hypothetical protein
VPVPDRRRDTLDKINWGEGTRRVVHQDDRVRRRCRAERVGDRHLPGWATLHHDGEARPDLAGEHRPYRFEIASRSGHHNAAHARCPAEPADGVDEQWCANELAQRLWRPGPQAGAGTGGGNEDHDVTADGVLRGHVGVLGRRWPD